MSDVIVADQCFSVGWKCYSVGWRRTAISAAVAILCLGVLFVAIGPHSPIIGNRAAGRYIVEGTSTAAVTSEVHLGHGKVVSNLPIVHGVVAKLTPKQAAAAEAEGLSVSPDPNVTVAGTGSSTLGSGIFTSVTGATSVWANGDSGSGVGVAVLDTGIDAALPDLAGRVADGVNLSSPATGTGGPKGWSTDQFGHGTFVAGLIASDGTSSDGEYTGVAPGVDLVSIKVAGASGITTVGTVVEGVGWAIAHKTQDNIRVLNMSLGMVPPTPSALDPLDQAVEKAWNAGIVVVVSAGNGGPDNGTITSPGNDPLVITVGAMDDNGADVPSGFSMPSFSGVGPTLFDGWFKPDLVAPGVSVVSLMAPHSTIDEEYPQAAIGTDNFVGSGTSFSTAIVSGLSALLISQDPSLTPNQVKAALLLTANPGPVGDPFVDGHGIANVAGAAQVAGQVNLDQAVAAKAESTHPPATISLASTWAFSSWNPANWSGPAWVASQAAASAADSQGSSVTSLASGTDWTGAAWNGAAWNGAAWNGAAWNGAAWNGAAWNDAAWSGAAWNSDCWGC